jgi:hypothetical protein
MRYNVNICDSIVVPWSTEARLPYKVTRNDALGERRQVGARPEAEKAYTREVRFGYIYSVGGLRVYEEFQR